MKIQLRNIKVRDVAAGYTDLKEKGVVGYSGKLDIRPAYQREFIYKPKQRDRVIQTVRQDFPLNTMYWAVVGDDYELMDGQQRTISVCQYVDGDFSVDWDGEPRGFHNLTHEEQEQILNYELSIYVCKGTDREKLDWFEIINIASEKLTDQELRNAIYTGPWLSDAKRWFSKPGAPAVHRGENLVKGAPIRQEVLEKALEWISGGKGKAIAKYMADHQHDKDASELWQYYQEVIAWVGRVFPNQDSARVKIMKGLEWGVFFNAHKGDGLNAVVLEGMIIALIDDDEVDNKKGIYEYLLTRNERSLSLRVFDEKTKQKKYQEQQGVCSICQKEYEYKEMEADHIVPWSKGGKTTIGNCQMLCKADNRAKAGK